MPFTSEWCGIRWDLGGSGGRGLERLNNQPSGRGGAPVCSLCLVLWCKFSQWGRLLVEPSEEPASPLAPGSCCKCSGCSHWALTLPLSGYWKCKSHRLSTPEFFHLLKGCRVTPKMFFILNYRTLKKAKDCSLSEDWGSGRSTLAAKAPWGGRGSLPAAPPPSRLWKSSCLCPAGNRGRCCCGLGSF